ncbi:Rrf2 family transcriptional regulator [Desulfovibrio sp. OttesenSCG-928-G15]|nr:Rrf2 family transcriptional regulator [Desulfovibrio sp. OttesenSCG-928-G15]
MKLSARSRYASRILLELARHKGAAPMSAATLSQHTGVSVQFVEQILKPLKQSGFTRSVRGAAGGHRLARPAEDITLGEVVRLMEGGITLTVCCGENANDCPRKDGCVTRKAWLKVSKTLESELDSITLSTLLHSGDVCPEAATRVLPRKRDLPQAKAATRAAAKSVSRSPRVISRKAAPVRRKAKGPQS